MSIFDFKNKFIKTVSIAGILAILASSLFSSVSSAVDLTEPFFDDFSAGDTSWTLFGANPGNPPYVDTEAQYLVLNESEPAGSAATVFLNKDVPGPFTAEFKYLVLYGSGADGFTFMFNKKKDYEPAGGGGLGFSAPAEADTPGYGVEFDSWFNPELGDDTANHIGLLKDRYNNHLIQIFDTRTEEEDSETWHKAKVQVDDSSVKVWIDDDTDPILSWTGEIDRTYSGIGFSSATGGAANWHIIDDVRITPVDTTSPETSIISGSSGTITTNSATFTYTGTDSTPPLTYSYKIDDGAWSDYSSSTTAVINNLSAGAHTFYVRAKDAVGNVDPTPASQAFTYTPPVQVTQTSLISTILSLKANKNAIAPKTLINLIGTLRDSSGKGLSGKQILIKVDKRRVAIVTTDKNGNFKLKVRPKLITKFNKASYYRAVFAGDSTYSGSTDNSKKIFVKKKPRLI